MFLLLRFCSLLLLTSDSRVLKVIAQYNGKVNIIVFPPPVDPRRMFSSANSGVVLPMFVLSLFHSSVAE